MKLVAQRLNRSVGGTLPVRYSNDNKTAVTKLKYFIIQLLIKRVEDSGTARMNSWFNPCCQIDDLRNAGGTRFLEACS